MNKLFVLFLLLPSVVYAQPADPLAGLKDAGRDTGLITDKTPSQMIAVVINALLALLGTLFTVYIILGGFKWMTSAGNTEQIQEAKKTIVNATMGLVIVIISYILATFIINTLANASGAGGSGSIPPGEGSFE